MLKDLTTIVVEVPLVQKKNLQDFKLSSKIKSKLNEMLGAQGYVLDSYTSSAPTSSENFAIIPNQYFLYATRLHEFATNLFPYIQLFDEVRVHAKNLVGDSAHILKELNRIPDLAKKYSSSDLDQFAKFLDKSDKSYRFKAKNLIDDEGKPRGAKDCFASVIGRKTNMPQASSNIFGHMIYDLCRDESLYSDLVIEVKKILSNSSVPSHFAATVKQRQLTKPFVILAGISGTGKTRFIREQVKASGDLSASYQLTAVRPDWHEPGDLLGYQSRLSGKAEYIVTDVLRFICKAWCAISNSDVEILSAIASGHGQACNVIGDKEHLQKIMPYWLCLDEMNLAPVEQYFADYLSILETREWRWEGSKFTYLCDPLLSPTVITDLAPAEQQSLKEALGFDDKRYDSMWACFCAHGIGIPFNLIVAGTVNMDETTHGFSRKVLDRALTIDFDEFFPNDFNTFFSEEKKPVILGYPVMSVVSKNELPDIDADGQKSIEFLNNVNGVLNNTPFKLAYRAVNELLIMVASVQPNNELQLKAVWDDFLMFKVLARIEGDIDKLGIEQFGGTVLTGLLEILEVEFSPFWNVAADTEGARPDLFRTSVKGVLLTASCRSRSKLLWMQKRLEVSGFTSFWP